MNTPGGGLSLGPGSEQGLRALRRAAAKGRSAARRAPLVTKAVPTAIGFAFGDILTQYMNWRGKRAALPAASKEVHPPFSYDWTRGAKMAAVGAVLGGPLGLGLLRWMDSHIMTHNPRGLAAMTVKLTLDQVVGCILWQASYMVIHPPYRQAAQELLASLQYSLQEQTVEVKRRLQPAGALA